MASAALVSAVSQPYPPEGTGKRLISLRYWMAGRNFHLALRALDPNRRLFHGLRKDGATPEFDHHVCQAHFVRTLPNVLFMEETLASVFFHDSPEDHGLSFQEIRHLYADAPTFGDRVANAVQRLTKTWRGQAVEASVIFPAMAECPIASLNKGVDRIHNQQSMVGVFTPAKQRLYLQETEEFILPMLKAAAQRFPEQEEAYKILRTVLKMQGALIDVQLRSLGV